MKSLFIHYLGDLYEVVSFEVPEAGMKRSAHTQINLASFGRQLFHCQLFLDPGALGTMADQLFQSIATGDGAIVRQQATQPMAT